MTTGVLRARFDNLIKKLLDDGVGRSSGRWKNEHFGKKIGASGQIVGRWRAGKSFPQEKYLDQILKAFFGSNPANEQRLAFAKCYKQARDERRARTKQAKHLTSYGQVNAETGFGSQSIAQELPIPFMPTREEDLRYFGNVQSFINWFTDHNSDLTYVKKVVYREGDNVVNRYRNHINKFERAMLLAMDSGCLWDEIVQVGDRAFVEATIAALSEQGRELYARQYNASELKTRMPIFQMLIMRHNDEQKTAIFGLSFIGSREAPVFWSKNSATVDYLEDYYDSLRRFSTHFYGRQRA